MEDDAVVFHINGIRHSVDGRSPGADGVLADYIRDVANLKGTKIMCREGGCGACICTVKSVDPNTSSEIIKSVNSCLTPVLSCDGWDISTIERLGNKHDGYHEIQNKIVNFHGTQCGFCTPGMVMSMYSLTGHKPDMDMLDVEKSLDGNLCRCTGYRPILDAFKALSTDSPADLKNKCADIEECGNCPLKKINAKGFAPCGRHAKESSPRILHLPSGVKWITAKTVANALKVAAECKPGHYRFVAGNTSTGIFKDDGPYQEFIDINGIRDLKRCYKSENGFVLGGTTTLTDAINLLKEVSNSPELHYGGKISTHLERIAHTSVRNNGTLAGNLMIKHVHPEFPSDIFVLLEGIGASITLVSLNSDNNAFNEPEIVSVAQFLKTNMHAKLVTSIHLPNLKGYHFRSFKITRRYQNAHAYVNAALLFKVDKASNFKVVERPRLVYGGISTSFIHASETEEFLTGKLLADVETHRGMLLVLESEVKPEKGHLHSAPAYRLHLTKTLLYKTILEIIGDYAPHRLRSGSSNIPRNLARNKQTIDGKQTDTALYKNVPKSEGAVQAAGEAEFTIDIPAQPGELFAAFVLTTVGNADLKDVDATDALKIPGVVAYVSAKDIPGENNVMNDFNYYPMVTPEPVFVADKVLYHGQAVGLVVAASRELASKAAKLVRVTYKNVKKPVITIPDAISKAKAEGLYDQQNSGTCSTPPVNEIKVKHILKGSFYSGSQYHFHMEVQNCVCHPREDGIDVYSSTQWIDFSQISIANVLNIPMNCVNMQVRRIGGGFGGKLANSAFVSTACAVASWVTKRPVRLVLDLETNMSMLGKRQPHLMPYEVGFDDTGRIGKLNVDLICDVGHAANDNVVQIGMKHMQNVYKAAGWTVTSHYLITNTPSGTFCRAPSSVKTIALMEWMMDQIAHYLKKDPLAVREANLLETGDPFMFDLYGGPPTFDGHNPIPGICN